ncbi:retroviral-like aspartic protease family protein [Xenorhabdus sp. Sc-CR9]|uniref:retroviral-like aspartic protease family protein n=1 Tax=Xenorhabdus sp. Sc-CR9 TaxID=2584468 RepID=UPI001F3826F6|nr:retroviral-like aspartic protease family protein [Xenorhabdus sp. Sc-CR9]
MKLIFGKARKIVPLLLCVTGLAGCTNTLANKVQVKNPATPETILDTHFENNLIVPVTINHKTWRFLVDTGASITVIDKNIAAEITQPWLLSELPANYRQEFSHVKTVSGSLENQNFTILKPMPFSIGSQEIRDNDIWLSMDLSLFVQSLGVDINGIIGIDTFRKINWQVDNEKKRLVLLKDGPSALAYQQCTGYEDSYNRMPQLWFNYGDNHVPFRIDTGADGSYVTNDFIRFAKEHKGSVTLDSVNSPGVDASGMMNAPIYILKGLTFNNMSLGETKVSESQNQQFAVGMEFLSRFKRYAFIPSRMMFCYDTQSIERHDLASKRSISVRYAHQHIEVFYNNDTALRNTGLRNGDILLKVNGVAYSPAQIDEVRKWLMLTPEGKLKLTVQRDTQQMEINL